MRKLKLSTIIIIILIILSGAAILLLRFINPSMENEINDEKKLTMELLDRISDQENFSDPLGIFNENGVELTQEDITTVNEDGIVTNVTRYEILKDIDGNDVKVKLKKQLVKEENGKEYECWVIDEQIKGRIKYYLGSIKNVNEKEIIFIVEKESKEMDLHTDKLVYEDIDDYEKTINLDEFKNKKCESRFIPSNDIYVGFKIMDSIDDFDDYFNKKIYLQETVLTYYENSPKSRLLVFREYY